MNTYTIQITQGEMQTLRGALVKANQLCHKQAKTARKRNQSGAPLLMEAGDYAQVYEKLQKIEYSTMREIPASLITAMEWGFKAHERGLNIQAAHVDFFDVILNTTSAIQP